MKIKTIYRIMIAVILITIGILFLTSFSDSAKKTSAEVQPQSPVIIIDAGHGGEDGGASVDGVLEKELNLQIAGKLADTLRLCGCEVKEIRSEDIFVYEDGASTLREKKVSDLKHRVAVANESDRNILVSIHQNKFDNSAYSGTQLFYSVNNDNSRVLAEAIRKSVTSLLQKENTRELKPANSDIYLLDQATVPAVIVECGFLSNDEERAKLMDDGYQSEMAYSIAMGVLEYIHASE